MRFAVVGCGGAGKRHAQQYSQLADVELVACVDIAPASADELASEYQAKAYTDVRRLLDEPLDGLSICTPPNEHIDVIRAALARDVHVLCEKPLAHRVAACTGLQPDGRLMCAFKFRHLAGARRLRDLIAAGELGTILNIRATAISNRDMSDSWFSDPEVAGGGVLLDNGVHLVDICQYLVGPVDRVSAVTSGGTRRLRVEETASVHLRLECGASVHLLVSWEAPAPMPPLVEVFGSAGYARLGYDLEVFDNQGGECVERISGADVNIWHEVVAAFVRFVAGQGEPSAVFADGFSALSVVEAAYASVISGRAEHPAKLGGAVK